MLASELLYAVCVGDLKMQVDRVLLYRFQIRNTPLDFSTPGLFRGRFRLLVAKRHYNARGARMSHVQQIHLYYNGRRMQGGS
jgi:hypothetical protein